MTVRLGRTKRSNSGDGRTIVLVGRPVVAWKAWMERAGINEGAVFRGIDQWGNLGNRAIMPETVNLILKTRARLAGLDPKNFSAHGLRSGFLTEAANRGVPLQEAMQQSLHKSAAYYNDSNRKFGKATRLMD